MGAARSEPLACLVMSCYYCDYDCYYHNTSYPSRFIPPPRMDLTTSMRMLMSLSVVGTFASSLQFPVPVHSVHAPSTRQYIASLYPCRMPPSWSILVNLGQAWSILVTVASLLSIARPVYTSNSSHLARFGYCSSSLGSPHPHDGADATSSPNHAMLKNGPSQNTCNNFDSARTRVRSPSLNPFPH